jgi:hypothetical protein
MRMPSALVVALSAAGAAIAADLPVTVGQLVVGPQAHVTVTNTAPQPVTAWALAILTHPESGRTRREVETIDGYLSEATHGLGGAATRLERLMPGESRVLPLDPLPQDAAVEIAAVVLDDGTAMGDETAIASVFDRRAKERDALGAVTAAFADVLAGQHGAPALEALAARLRALPAADAAPCRAAIDAVETYRRRAGSPDQIDASLRKYSEFVAREYALAKRHASRRR